MAKEIIKKYFSSTISREKGLVFFLTDGTVNRLLFSGVLSIIFFATSFIVVGIHPIPSITLLSISLGIALSWQVSIIVGFETLYRGLERGWVLTKIFKVYEIWVWSFIIFVCGFINFCLVMVLVFKNLHQQSFVDFSYYFENERQFLLRSPNLFLRFLPFWALGTVGVSYQMLKGNQSTKWDKQTKKANAYKRFVVTSSQGAESIDPTVIKSLTVKEHYTYLQVGEKEKIRDVEVKMPFKNVLDQLPEELFLKVHRSHAVNLEQVIRFEKKRGISQIILQGIAEPIPVSRSFLTNSKERIKNYFLRENI